MFTESSYILFIITAVCLLPECGHIVQVLYPHRLWCDWLKGSCKKKKKNKGYFYFDFLKLSSINVKFGVYVECTINHLYFTDQKDSLSHFCGVTPLNFAICTDFVLHQWYSFFKCKLWYLHYFLIGFLQSASSVNVFPKFELQIAFNPLTCLLCLFLNVMRIWMTKWGKN